VFAIENEHAKFHKLRLGIGDESNVEVLAGLAPGSVVVTTGRTSLEDGMAVHDTAAEKDGDAKENDAKDQPELQGADKEEP